MVFKDKRNANLYAYLVEIERWCEETFRNTPMYLRRMPRPECEEELEREAGRKLKNFKCSSLYKRYMKDGDRVLSPEELQLLEIYNKIKREYDKSILNIQGQNLLIVEQWCKENFAGKPKYLRRLPTFKDMGTKGRKKISLGQNISLFRKTPIFQKYQIMGKDGLEDAERELIEKYEDILSEYNYENLNIHGQNLLDIEQWCRENFDGKPKYLRGTPDSNAKGEEGKRERKLGEALGNFETSSFFQRYQISGKEGLNDAERELIEKYEAILQEYDYRYLNKTGMNLKEIQLWCQEFEKIPRSKIKGIRMAKKGEMETAEQREVRLGTVWSNFKLLNKLYKKYKECGIGVLNEAERELIDIAEQIQREYGATQKTTPTKRLIEYKGKSKTLPQIAKEENIPVTTLRNYFDKYENNIYKAVFMCKVKERKRQTVKIANGKMNLRDLALTIGIKYEKLVNLLARGLSIEQIKEEYTPHKKNNRHIKHNRENNELPDGQTLLEYCLENGLNYSFIYRAINTYGKTLEEATKEYQNKGSKMPNMWIFERYDLLLRHLFTSMQIDINAIVRYMREEYISIGVALEKYIIRKNAKHLNLDPDWLEEVYEFLSDDNIQEQIDEFKRTFYIGAKEEECIAKSSDQIQAVERRLLLFEIAEVIKEKVFLEKEIPELLRMYEVTPEEIEVIFLDLYSRFQGGKLLGENEPEMRRRNILNGIIKKWYYLGQEDRKRILLENKVTEEEQQRIIELSSQIVKHKCMLKPTDPTNPLVLE